MSTGNKTENLGLVKAIFVGVNPPVNINVIWYDDNVGVKIHKYYDVITSAWEPIAPTRTSSGLGGTFATRALAVASPGADDSPFVVYGEGALHNGQYRYLSSDSAGYALVFLYADPTKADKTDTGDKTDLTTADQTTIVAGVNEVDAKAIAADAKGQQGIDDSAAASAVAMTAASDVAEISAITVTIATGTNLFDKSAPLLLENGYYNNTNTLISSTSWITTHLIPVLPNTEYVISPFPTSASVSFANGFDASGVPINVLTLVRTVGTKATFTTGPNDITVAFGIFKTTFATSKETLQIELGDTPSAYSEYTGELFIMNENILGFADLVSEVAEFNSLTTTDPTGKNLFDESGEFWLENAFYQNGNLISNNSFIASPLVEIPPFTRFTVTPFQASNTFFAIYCVDEDGVFLGNAVEVSKTVGAGSSGFGVFETLRYTKYISLPAIRSVYSVVRQLIQVELGSTQTSFEAYIPELLIDPNKIKDYDTLSADVERVSGLRSLFPNPNYEGISDKFPNFRESVLRKLEDTIVVITGTSLSQGTPWASLKPAAEASIRPPLLFTNNFASGVYDELAKFFPDQQHRRYDHAFFTEIGSGFTVAKDDALWDTSTYVEGYTKFSTAANSGVTFGVLAEVYRLNFIYRTDSLGDTFTVSITEGDGLMEAFDGANWVEANNFSGTMLEPAVTTTKGNTIYQKRLSMRCKDRLTTNGIDSIGQVKNVTITKGNNTNRRFLFVGVEWSRTEHMLMVINGARGTHNWGTGTLDLSRFQDGDIHSHNPNMILAEITTINWAGSNKSSLSTSPNFYINNIRKWYFNELDPDNPSDTLEPNSLFAKTNGYTTSDVLFYNDTMTGATSSSGPWEADGTISWGEVTQAGDWQGVYRNAYLSYQVGDEYMRREQPTRAFISINREFRRVSESHFGSFFDGLQPTGATGVTLSNDGVHYNDNGNALLLSLVLPAFKF